MTLYITVVSSQIQDDAAYLYDAVMLYALSLNETLADGGSITNGTDIINRVLDRSFQSKPPFFALNKSKTHEWSNVIFIMVIIILPPHHEELLWPSG